MDISRKFSVNKICLNELTYEQAVDATARTGFHAITPWFDDVAHLTPSAARNIAENAGLDIGGFCNCGLFALKGRENRQTAINEAKRNIDYAAEIGSPSIVTVVGGLLPGSKDLEEARSYAFDCLAETLEHARQTPVTLALEALHPMYTPDWSVVATLSVANDWCDRLGEGIGMTVDSYHNWWDPALSEELVRAGRHSRIVTYHISDWRVPTSHLLLDRGMPGDGVIDLAAFDRLVIEQGYDGFVEIEIFSERHWSQHPEEFLNELMSRCKSIYGQ